MASLAFATSGKSVAIGAAIPALYCMSCFVKRDAVNAGWDLGGAPKSDAINTASTPAQSKYLPNMIPTSSYGTSEEARRGDQDRELVEFELFFETRSGAFQPAILREVGQLFRGHRALEPGLRHVLQMVDQFVNQDRLFR
jgi:hypothetical protein